MHITKKKQLNRKQKLPPRLLSPCSISDFGPSGQTSVSSTKKKKKTLSEFLHHSVFTTDGELIIIIIITNYHSIFIQLGHPSFFEVKQIWLQLRQTKVM